MLKRILSISEPVVLAGARVALGIGVGLLLSRRIRRNAPRFALGGLLALNVETVNVNNTLNVTNTFPIVISPGSKPDPRQEDPAA